MRFKAIKAIKALFNFSMVSRCILIGGWTGTVSYAIGIGGRLYTKYRCKGFYLTEQMFGVKKIT